MRVTSPRLPLIALVAAAALVSLAGCSPEPAVPPAPPTAPAEPLFATDAEALAAAEAAFEEYLAVTNKILMEGGEGEEKLRPLVSDEVFNAESAGFASRKEKGWKSVGGTKLMSAELQQISNGIEEAEVITFVCLSYENVDVVDRSGESVISPDRPPFAMYEAVFRFVAPDTWTLERNTFWETPESCS